ncbi:MAG: zinc-dependent metalloprotease [Cyclobacteriaceae bacterium]
MKKTNLFLIAVFLFSSICLAPNALAQKSKKKKKKGEVEAPATPKKKEEKGPKKVKDAVKKHDKIEGLFTFYRDSVSGGLKMIIAEDQLEKEFIHFYYVENGVVEAGVFKGNFRGSKIFKIRKYYNKIEFVKQNTSFYFDPANPMSKAADANISEAIMYSGKIVAGSPKEKQYLIEADPIFLKDVLGIVDRTAFFKNPKAFKLGGLSSSKTKYSAINNYTDNTDIIVEYAFDNKKPNSIDSDAITDSRFITIKVQHSLIAVPDNDYQKRFEDPRVGYFTTQVSDLTSKETVNYRDLIHRWDLQKKDPSASVSEPVKPITWWIENTTPYEFRESIKDGVLAWNAAFEQAGFKNAMVVKVQPDTADWDAGDINYNVLRWTSSPRPPFGGYGPSFVNPRTGQIIGADIMLEYVYHIRGIRYQKLLGETADFGFESNVEIDPHQCSAGRMMHQNLMFGITKLRTDGASEGELTRLQKENMKSLIMHEVGHTLGLNHNMKASQRFSPAQLADKELINGECLTGSVMDYTLVNLTKDKSDQGQYFDYAVGPYDKWAIEYGYKVVDSEADLEPILQKSTQPELIFGNDADDMRSPGKAIDPRVMIFDQSNDQIGYSIDRIEIVNSLMSNLKDKYTTDGKSFQELYQAFRTLVSQYGNSGTVISRFIGGVYVDRAMAGQEGATQPYTPVSYKDQKRAMNALAKYIFAPDAFSFPTELYNYLAYQRRGFDFFNGPEDPKIHSRVITYQKGVLTHLLHKNTMQRITDSELYGNKYLLSEFMTDLNNAVFKADAYKSVNTFRQNLQIEYVKKLASIVGEKSGYSNHAKSMALYNLKNIKRLYTGASGNLSTKAHRQHLAFLVDEALDRD